MPIVDLSFVLVGTTIPLDHGYSLFSALCGIVPALHGDRASASTRSGGADAPGRAEPDQAVPSEIRLPSEEIAPYIAVAGKRWTWRATICAWGFPGSSTDPRGEPGRPAGHIPSRHGPDRIRGRRPPRAGANGDRRDAPIRAGDPAEVRGPTPPPRDAGQGSEG